MLHYDSGHPKLKKTLTSPSCQQLPVKLPDQLQECWNLTCSFYCCQANLDLEEHFCIKKYLSLKLAILPVCALAGDRPSRGGHCWDCSVQCTQNLGSGTSTEFHSITGMPQSAPGMAQPEPQEWSSWSLLLSTWLPNSTQGADPWIPDSKGHLHPAASFE